LQSFILEYTLYNTLTRTQHTVYKILPNLIIAAPVECTVYFSSVREETQRRQQLCH
jgi:hypothetical protein